MALKKINPDTNPQWDAKILYHISITFSLILECCGKLQVITGMSTHLILRWALKVWLWTVNKHLLHPQQCKLSWARHWTPACSNWADKRLRLCLYTAVHWINRSGIPYTNSLSSSYVSPGWASLFRPACCRLWATGAWWRKWRSCAGSLMTVKTPSTRTCWWRYTALCGFLIDSLESCGLFRIWSRLQLPTAPGTITHAFLSDIPLLK